MIFDFINILFTPFGFELLPFSELCSTFVGFDNWYDILSPDVLISWLFYVAFAYGMLYICFILPFRFFKHIVRVPDKKGRVK